MFTAIIHLHRKMVEKTDAVIYGICTDGNEFMFLRIDNESRVQPNKETTYR